MELKPLPPAERSIAWGTGLLKTSVLRRKLVGGELETRGERFVEAIAAKYNALQGRYPEARSADHPIVAPGYEITSSLVIIPAEDGDALQRIDFQFHLRPMPYAYDNHEDLGFSQAACDLLVLELREALRSWGWVFPPPPQDLEACWLALIRGSKEPCDPSGHELTVTAILRRSSSTSYSRSVSFVGDKTWAILTRSTAPIAM
ncbi:hypothetical protein P7B02_01335 [Caulobacter segnis]|uniref:hypothetical protein n=1 Tax=Caulobacter segnis TaxID=88688 RepID=UPI00240F5DEC|nr:hypothetical protein [Caulobacter segnis]MDG2520167.1 hypothetical protein [Caulobacter segnis]